MTTSRMWVCGLGGVFVVVTWWALRRRPKVAGTPLTASEQSRKREVELRTIADPVRRVTLKHNVEGRIVIIGDIHGCADELNDLLEVVHFREDVDTLVLAGDLVGKGPQPLEVVRRAMSLGAHSVMGNHDWTVMRWHQSLKSGGETPMYVNPMGEHRRLALDMPADSLQYISNMAHVIDIPQYNAMVVHAGLLPHQSVNTQNTFDMMHMRNLIRGDSGPTEMTSEGVPWATRWPSDAPTVVFGHDAVRGLQDFRPRALGLDTGCVYGRELTAVVLPGWSLHSVAARAVHSAPKIKVR